jgi:hypothetical protein
MLAARMRLVGLMDPRPGHAIRHRSLPTPPAPSPTHHLYTAPSCILPNDLPSPLLLPSLPLRPSDQPPPAASASRFPVAREGLAVIRGASDCV